MASLASMVCSRWGVAEMRGCATGGSATGLLDAPPETGDRDAQRAATQRPGLPQPPSHEA